MRKGYNVANEKRIVIVKDGPYLVFGTVPLIEELMCTVGEHREYKPGRDLAQAQTYALCRCGRTKTPPFCDGEHQHYGFDGTETADRRSFAERAEMFTGPTLDLLDDQRCAYARFCHRMGSEVWTLTEGSDDPTVREEAIKASQECPTGRLVHLDKEQSNRELEPQLEPEISVLQDGEKGCSGPLYVKGGIPLISADGTEYELRNRYALCRCGESHTMPFCDAAHINFQFQDDLFT